MFEKQKWVAEAKRLNPGKSDDTLGSFYDRRVKKYTPPSSASNASEAIPEKKAPYIGPLFKTPKQALEEAGMLSHNDVGPTDAKTSWVSQAKKLNPNKSVHTLESFYDRKVAKSTHKEPSEDEQLQAIIDYNEKTKSESKEEGESDHDDDKAGFDNSDKMAMLGSLYHSGRIGVEEFGAGLKQLSLGIGKDIGAEKLGFQDKDATEKFTKHFNRKIARDKLYKQAVISHPTISTIGRFAGGTLPYFAQPELSAESVGRWASKFGAEKLAQMISKHPSIAKYTVKAVEGAELGAVQYQKEGRKFSNIAAAALMNMAIPGGGALIKKSASAIAKKTIRAAEKYGINFPTMPSAEKLFSHIPGSGVIASAKERGEQIAEKGRKIAKSIIGSSGDMNYGKVLHGEFLRTYETNKKAVSVLHEKIGKEAKKFKDIVILKNYQKVIETELERQKELPLGYQNKALIKKLEAYKNTPLSSYLKTNNIKKVLGNELGRMERGSGVGAYTKQDVGTMKQLYKALKTDMGFYAEVHGGKIKKMHDIADKLYKTKVVPFESGEFKKYAEEGYNTDKFIGEFLKPEGGFKASQLIDNLPKGSKKGLEAARAAILNHAMEAAHIPGAGFNSEKFIKEALRLRKANNVIFTKEQLGALHGYQKLINFAKKLGTEQLSTAKNIEGQGALNHIIFKVAGVAGAALHPLAAVAILGGARATRAIINSKAGRILLLKISAHSGKTSDSAIIDALVKAMRITATTSAAKVAGAL